jgi:hypothetical protein
MWRENEEETREGVRRGGNDLNSHADTKVRDRNFVAIHRVVVILRAGRSET